MRDILNCIVRTVEFKAFEAPEGTKNPESLAPAELFLLFVCSVTSQQCYALKCRHSKKIQNCMFLINISVKMLF